MILKFVRRLWESRSSPRYGLEAGFPLAGHTPARIFMLMPLIASRSSFPGRFKAQDSSLSNRHAARLQSRDIVRSPVSRLWRR
jgi:hypothetical protein